MTITPSGLAIDNSAMKQGAEGHVVRRLPVYRDGDTHAKPTGGTRQIQYKLAAGEAGWVLRADKVVEY